MTHVVSAATERLPAMIAECTRHDIEALRTERVIVRTSSANRSGLLSEATTYAIMTAELTQEVSRRLESDRYVWLTTVAKSGQPVPRLVWFFFDGQM